MTILWDIAIQTNRKIKSLYQFFIFLLVTDYKIK